MCVKSHRHLCLQIFLIIVLVLCLLAVSTFILTSVGFYLLTSTAATVQNDSSQSAAIVSSSLSPALANDQMILVDPSTNMTITAPQAQVADDTAKTDDDENDPNDDVDVPLADTLVDWIKSRGCLVNSTVQSGQLLQICDVNVDPFASDSELVKCFRTTAIYSGLAALLPALLIFLSTIAVCRLLMCPILTLAIVYILLAIALVVGAILFNSGVIVQNIDTDDSLPALFHVALFLVVLYTILSLLLILLFALVTCEQRRMRQNGDAEKIMKQSTDDEDDIDDPNAPLYENGYSPAKKNDFEEKIKEFKFIDDDMSYIFRKG